MRSFRARIERGRIIVHEPIDLPDGVVYLVALDKANADPGLERPVDAKAAVLTATSPVLAVVLPADRGHSSSS
jgi:hypothetical protein